MENIGNVLIADDDEGFASRLTTALCERGFACTRAPDVHAMARVFEVGVCDLLVSEIQVSGESVVEWLKHAGPMLDGLPVILTAAEPSLESVMGAVGLGVASYQVKPVDLGDLVAKASSSIRASHLARQLAQSEYRFAESSRALGELREVAATTPGADLAELTDTFMAHLCENTAANLRDLCQLRREEERTAGEPCAQGPCERARLTLPVETLHNMIGLIEGTEEALEPSDPFFVSLAGISCKKHDESVNSIQSAENTVGGRC